MPVTLVCDWCRQSFRVPPAHQHKQRFCSGGCRDAWKRAQDVVCEQCGTRFHAPPSWIATGTRFCSHACASAAKRVPLEERFWSKVNKDGPVLVPELGPCWVWTGWRNAHGYGRIVHTETPRRLLYAHRLAFELTYGPLAPGEQAMHRCDNPACVRPDHLERGSQRANNADRDSKGRVRHGERHANAKLSATDVERARTLYATGAISQRALADLFGVSRQTIADALTGRSWKRSE